MTVATIQCICSCQNCRIRRPILSLIIDDYDDSLLEWTHVHGQTRLWPACNVWEAVASGREKFVTPYVYVYTMYHILRHLQYCRAAFNHGAIIIAWNCYNYSSMLSTKRIAVNTFLTIEMHCSWYSIGLVSMLWICSYVHFADVIGCNNMLMLKYCKSLRKFAKVFGKLLRNFGAFVLFYFRLFYMCEQHNWNYFWVLQ